MKVTKYVYGTDPSLVPLSDSDGWDDEIIKAAGFDPNDEEVAVCTLVEDWNGHKEGATVVTGCTVEGHPFAVVEEE